MQYRLGEYLICPDSQELLYKQQQIKIEPLIFKLLVYLIENPDRLVTHDELIESVWESSIVTTTAVFAAISIARKAIGDNAKEQKHIKTIPRRGYRFIAKFSQDNNDHSVFNKNGQQHSSLIQRKHETYFIDYPAIERSDALPAKPSVAVLDFTNQDTSPQNQLFSFALTTEINAGLARLPHLEVIARASASYITKQQLTPTQIGKSLSVRYLIYGSAQLITNRIRATISIVDSTNNTEIWSEHYDRAKDDLFLIQDEVTSSIVSSIDATIEKAEIERSFIAPTEDLSAWENYYRGIWHINKTKPEHSDTAETYFTEALKLDPAFSRAYAGLSHIYTNRNLFHTISDLKNKTYLSKALEFAEQSIDYCQRESMGYASMGRALYFSKKHDSAVEVYDKALALNPSFSQCYIYKGVTLAHSRDTESVQTLMHTAQRLSPYDPVNFLIYSTLATLFTHLKDYKEAARWGVRAANAPNAYFITFAVAAGCLYLAGKKKLAQQYTKELLSLQPDFSVKCYKHMIPHAHEPTRSAFMEALHQSGIPRL